MQQLQTEVEKLPDLQEALPANKELGVGESVVNVCHQEHDPKKFRIYSK
jgi:hypothetical protein